MPRYHGITLLETLLVLMLSSVFLLSWIPCFTKIYTLQMQQAKRISQAGARDIWMARLSLWLQHAQGEVKQVKRADYWCLFFQDATQAPKVFQGIAFDVKHRVFLSGQWHTQDFSRCGTRAGWWQLQMPDELGIAAIDAEILPTSIDLIIKLSESSPEQSILNYHVFFHNPS